jgi:hypothetical protein
MRDLSKPKCYICHKNGHYASQCPEKKKGRRKTQQAATTTKTQLSELATKFERDFSLVSCISTSIIARSAWYLDSGASRHMTKVQELFKRLAEEESELHVELGNDAKYAV